MTDQLPKKFKQLIIKHVPTNQDRNRLFSVKDHFLIYDHINLSLTCLDCGHTCVCCENSVIYNTVDSFMEHLKIAHDIDIR